MKLLLIIFILPLLLFLNCAQSGSSIISELLNLICIEKSVDSSRIKFWLYTRNSTTATQLNASSPVMEAKKTIVLIHGLGFKCTITENFIPGLKDAYLVRYDANVILADWCYYTNGVLAAYCRVANMGKVIAEFLMVLERKLSILVESIHVLGHSFGGQIAGLTGSYLRTTYSKSLKRITGLDPAGPLFSWFLPGDRLDKTDASFVDVIHTNAGIAGYTGRCGHVDYYPGCGTIQNGCLIDADNISLDFIFNLGCSHHRCIDYMSESINSNKFRCQQKLEFCFRNRTKISYMGEDSILSYTDDSYICDTNPSSPFAKG